MSTKNKLILIFLSVITFGIYPLIIFKLAKPTSHKPKVKLTIDVESLKTILGPDNILGVEYLGSKVKFFLTDARKVDQVSLKKLPGVTGVVQGKKYISIIVGPVAKELAAQFDH